MNAQQRRKARRAIFERSIWGRGAWCGICGETIEEPDEVHGEMSTMDGSLIFTCRRRREFHPTASASGVIHL